MPARWLGVAWGNVEAISSPAAKDVPDWENVYPVIVAIVALVGKRIPLLTSRKSVAHPRQLAAAYLARCRRLVLTLDLVRSQGFEDMVGALLRMTFESWLFGLWTLYGDPRTVLDAHDSDFTRRMNRVVVLADLDAPQMPGNGDGPSMPSVEVMARQVGEEMTRQGDPGGEQMLFTYNSVYRMESARGIHGGMASVLHHMVDDEERWSIREKRLEASDGTGELLWAGALLGYLARRVFLAFGIGVTDLDHLTAPIRELAMSLNEKVATGPALYRTPPLS